MANLQLKQIQKSFGETHVLKSIDLDISDGEFVVFVGPSGCGKSTLLRIIAGLETPTSGEIFIEDVKVNDKEPLERGIAMVFQSYALYPHMSVYDNMAFGLKLAKADKAEIDKLVNAAAKTLHIEHLLVRKPKELSGGQRQRVAIGRAIVRKPKVFLFDEPLSNLDAALRVKMRYEFARLRENLKTTMIYVTHDQVEAMTLADRIVVLDGGNIAQCGTPMELYDFPNNLFVAGFMGSPKMNFLRGNIHKAALKKLEVKLENGHTLSANVAAQEAKEGDAITLGIRPENIIVNGANSKSSMRGKVLFVEKLGGLLTAHIGIDKFDSNEPIIVQLPHDFSIKMGDEISLELPSNHCHVFDLNEKAFERT